MLAVHARVAQQLLVIGPEALGLGPLGDRDKAARKPLDDFLDRIQQFRIAGGVPREEMAGSSDHLLDGERRGFAVLGRVAEGHQGDDPIGRVRDVPQARVDTEEKDTAYDYVMKFTELVTNREEGTFRAVFQPVFESGGSAISWYEALLRVKRPTGEYVSVYPYLAVAKSTGFYQFLTIL